MAGDYDYPTYDAGGRVEVYAEGGKAGQPKKHSGIKNRKMGPGPEDSPSMKEALRHKAGIEKSEKIERGIYKYPELFKHYKPFKSSEESKYAEGGKVKKKRSGFFSKERIAERRAKRQEKRNLKKINKRAVSLEKKKEGAGQDYVKVPKNVEPKKIKATGKIGKKPTSVTLTEGGAFPTYKKESKKAKSFRSAFAEASKAGKKTFTWDGRKYTTKKK